MTDKRIYATGKRKTAIARVWMKEGSGAFTINNRNFDDYFTRDVLKKIIRQPLEITSQVGRFDFYVNVDGGGIAVWDMNVLSPSAAASRVGNFGVVLLSPTSRSIQRALIAATFCVLRFTSVANDAHP